MSTFLDRPQSTLFRRALFQVHIWVGVLTGLYIFVVCTTGAALVFRIEMQRAMHPALFTPARPGPVAHPADVIESVGRSFPGQTVFGVDAPTTTRPTYLAYARGDTRLLTLLLLTSVYLDHYTGASLTVPTARRTLGDTVMAWIAPLHVGGFNATGLRVAWFLLGLAPPALFVTGFIMWWTRVMRPRLMST